MTGLSGLPGVQPFTAAELSAMRPALAEFNAGVTLARAEYEMRPSEFDRPRYCVVCSGLKRDYARPRCAPCENAMTPSKTCAVKDCTAERIGRRTRCRDHNIEHRRVLAEARQS